ncbi:uncharacterized protein LOC134249184 [Saccostrea cucullata]|uniref:uncharacterized protein LOC134249184 n=1 Tax=Saccostrea cuccullata TaxID=36930 RepID=UPI002ED5A4CC
MIVQYVIGFCLFFAFSHGLSKDENKMVILEKRVKDLEDLATKLLRKVDLAERNIQSLLSENIQIKKELKYTSDQVQDLENQTIPMTDWSSSPRYTGYGSIKSLQNMKNLGQNHKNHSEKGRHLRQLEFHQFQQYTHSIMTKQRIGFTAVTTDHQTHMGINQSILFLNVIENVGNGLDPFTSVFKAPVSGLYIFSVSLVNHPGLEVRASIVKNGNPVVRIFSGDSTTYASGTSTIVLDLSINDDVWVRITDASDININGGAWSSFTGVLVS